MNKLTRTRLDFFLKSHSTTSEVLDVGSGGSSYDRFFPHRFTVDLDPARKPDIVADASKLPFQDGRFSFILCTEVLEHTLDPQVVINELYRVLAPGGKIILTTRFVYPLHDTNQDYWRFTRLSLTRLFSKFVNLTVTSDSKDFSTLAILLQRIVFQDSLRGGRFTKVLIMFLAYVFERLDWVVLQSYGDIKKSTPVAEMMSAGYYVVAYKK